MKYISGCLLVLLLLMISVPGTQAKAQSSCSQNGSGVEMALSVPNLTDQRLSIYWVDFQCKEQLIAAVKPGKVFYQTTHDGHEWIFRDPSGQTVKQFTASVNSPMVPIGVTSYNADPVTSNCSNSGSSEKIDLTVINNTKKPVLLFWIAFDCSEQLYEIVAGQDQFVQETFIGHDWVVRRPGGKLAKQITLSTAENTVVIDPPADGTVTTGTTAETGKSDFPITESGCEVKPVTPDMGLEDFYAKYCDYQGLVIASSDSTDDAALEQAWLIAANVLYNRPDVVESLVKMKFKIVVLHIIEFNTDVPELAYMADDPDVDIDDFRAYAKVLEEPRLATTPQENLLCSIGDSSSGQSLFVETLGNLTRFALVQDLDPEMGDKVEAARQNAITNGIWSPSPWITDSNGSYWNYGVQTYFNSSFDGMTTGPTDDYTNTRDELASYDPQLYTLIDEVYHSEDWTPTCPEAK